jgi:mannose-1-phosphate guanylyltransferase
MQSFIQRRFGETKPKQYCTFVGSRSLLQHAVDRADALTSPKRRIVVAAKHHEPYLREQMLGRSGGRILFQPENRGTAPGIFLPLTYVLAMLLMGSHAS